MLVAVPPDRSSSPHLDHVGSGSLSLCFPNPQLLLFALFTTFDSGEEFKVAVVWDFP